MNEASGHRTFPTVKPLATMNNKNLRHLEFRIGVIQAVVLTGLTMGAIVCAFLVGFISGQNKGHENAMASTETSIARLPIADESALGARRSEAKPAFAKLSEETSADEQVAGSDKPKALPDLSFARLDNQEKLQAPLDESAVEAGKKIESAVSAIQAARNGTTDDLKPASESGVRVLGQPAQTGSGDSSRTLGALLPPREEPQAASVLNAGAAVDEVIPAVEPTQVSRAAEAVGVTRATIAPVQKPTVKTVEQSAKVTTKPTPMRDAEISPSKIRPGWFAQVAAPNKKADADALVKKLKGSGFNVVVESAKVRGEDYFRVLVGPEENRAMAERLVSQLNREAYIQGAPFIRMVK